MIVRALLLIAVVSALASSAEAQTPWRLGEPELVWRYEPKVEGAHLGTLVVHPEGGVAAIAAEDRRIGLFRVAASGAVLWDRFIAARDSRGYAHIAFLHRDEGVDTIVAAPGHLTVVGPTGAERWMRTADDIGIPSMGVAIARRTPAGDFIVVGGEGVDANHQSVPMAASLNTNGERRWLATGPWPADIAPPLIALEDIGPYDWDPYQLPTVALPLRVLDDGGAVLLVGCGHMGGHVYYATGRLPELPCAPRSAMPLVAIDSSGRVNAIVVAGTSPSRAQSERWRLPPTVMVDATLNPSGTYWGGPAWNPQALPRFLPSVWWFGPSASGIVQFLRRAVYPRGRYDPEPNLFVVYDGASPARRSPSPALFPAADVVVDGEVAYLLLAPAEWHGPRQVTLIAVRRSGVTVLATRATPPFQRVRYAPQEGALYALQGNDIVRMRVIRDRG